MTINATIVRADYRGTHTDTIRLAVESSYNETIQDFMERCEKLLPTPGDYVELRVVQQIPSL